MAQATAALRLGTPSLRHERLTWVRMVEGRTPSRAAISFVVSPRAMAPRIASWRSVSEVAGSAGRARTPRDQPTASAMQRPQNASKAIAAKSGAALRG